MQCLFFPFENKTLNIGIGLIVMQNRFKEHLSKECGIAHAFFFQEIFLRDALQASKS
jgi:hypothetical protein